MRFHRPARRIALGLGAAGIALGLATCASSLAVGLRVDAAAETNVHNAATADKPVPVSPSIVPGHKLSGPAPKYPPYAKKAKMQGVVILEAVINRTGDVIMLHEISGPAPLQQSALEAVKDWKFSPFLKHGNPVSVTTKIQVDFKLH